MDKRSASTRKQRYQSLPGSAFSELSAPLKGDTSGNVSQPGLENSSMSIVDRGVTQSVMLSNTMWTAIREGSSIADLISASPEEVISALREHSIEEVTRFTVNESDALLAFGMHKMLTRGCLTKNDENCEENWKALIRSRASGRQLTRRILTGGWDQQVTVVAYVVNIKNAASGKSSGLLYPLVQKSLSGAATDDIWEFDAVQAIIEYKWRHWARRYLLIEFILYLGWVISYSIFLILFIECDVNKEGGLKQADSAQDASIVSAKIFDFLAALFMLPFLVIEYNTIVYYRERWLQAWNLLDFSAYVLQIIILVGHFASTGFPDSAGYSTLLAIQCSLLYIKVQYFSRLFGSGSFFAQLIAQVIHKVRGFLLFIGLSMASAVLSFAVLYRQDTRRESPTDAETDLKGVLKSVVTMFAALLGEFDSGYVFGTRNSFVKGAYFVCFQMMMSITVLNLLIAVMTESYAKVIKKERIMNNMGRAQVMEELEIALPVALGPKLKPYCHFIVIEREPKKADDVMCEGILSQTSTAPDVAVGVQITELRQYVEELKSSMEKEMQELKSMMHRALSKQE